MNECKLVEDLLPLYAEDLVSRESADFIRDHCTRCPQCNKLLERTAAFVPTQTEEAPTYQKALKRDRTRSVLFGFAIAVLILCFAATVFVVGYMPQKLDAEPIILESPDGVHSVRLEPYTSWLGINQGYYMVRRDSTYNGSSGTTEGWIEILDAQWSPDGTDLFFTVRMQNGETRMEIWFDNKVEKNSHSGVFPYITKSGWDYDDLSKECAKLLKRHRLLPDGWSSITWELVAWGDDSESAYLRWRTDNGHEEITYFGFDFMEKDIWIIE